MAADKKLIDAKEKYKYDEEFAIELCIGIAEGDNLMEIVKRPDSKASYHIVRQWIKYIPEFETAFWQAKKEAAEAIYSEIQEIERRMRLPASVPEVDIFGEPMRNERTNRLLTMPNPEHISPQAGRSLINSLQWRAEKTDPDRYGQKMHVKTEDLTLQNRIIEARERLRNARNNN